LEVIMKKSLYASVAVLALVLASPALSQRDDRDNKDENAPRAGRVSHDNSTLPREQNRERPSPTVSPTGTMGGENRGRLAPSGTMGTGTMGTGTMGTERGTRHERGTTNPMRPTTTVRPNAGTGTMAPRTGGTIGGGAHVHNPAFNSMRRVFNAPRRFRLGTYRRPSGWYYHRWTFGEFLPAFFFTSNYWILDWGNFYLDPPPPGTVWVRVGDDALLIDRYTGEVIEVVYGIFY
jgi:Ni/Co efflux regulator RcnB